MHFSFVCLFKKKKKIRVHVQEQVKRAERQFRSLPQHHQNLLPGVLSNLARISQCVDHNQEVLQAIVHNSLNMFENIGYGERVRLDQTRCCADIQTVRYTDTF